MRRSGELVYAAREALARAREAQGGDEAAARAEAMRAAGSALALDPGCAPAAEIVAELLGDPPREVPEEAAAELHARELARHRSAVRTLALRSLTWLALAWVPFGMPIRDPVAAIAILVGIVALVALTGTAALWGASDKVVRRILLVGAAAACAGLAGIYGPLVMVPAFAATTTTLHALVEDRRERRLVIGMGVLAVLFPFGLELAGVIPPSMIVEDGRLVILPRVVEYTPGLGIGFLALASTLVVITPAFAVGRAADALHDAERKLVLSGWHLRALRRQSR